MTEQQRQQFYQWSTATLLAVAGILFLLMPLLATSWDNQPFLGLYYGPNNVIARTLPAQSVLPLTLETPILHPERVQSIDGVLVQNRAQLFAELGSKKIGDEVVVELLTPSLTDLPEIDLPTTRTTRTLTIPIIQHTFTDLFKNFWSIYVGGLVTYLVGIWTFRQRPKRRESQLLALFTTMTALAIALVFDSVTGAILLRIWLIVLPLAGITCLLLALTFPQEFRLTQQRSYLKGLLFVPAIIIIIEAQITLYSPTAPWAYIASWEKLYLLDGICLVLSLAIFAYRAYTAESPLVRQQGILIFVSSILSFAPVLSYFILRILFVNYIPSWFTSNLFLPSIAIFPLSIGYTIIRYRLLDIEIKQTLQTTILKTIPLVFLALLIVVIAWFIQAIVVDPVALAVVVLILTLVLNRGRRYIQTRLTRYFWQPSQYSQLLQASNKELAQAVHSEQVTNILSQYTEKGIPHTTAHIYLYSGDSYTRIDDPRNQYDADDPLVSFLQKEPGALYIADKNALPPALQTQKQTVQRLNAAVIVPLLTSETLLGWLTISPKNTGERYTQLELTYVNTLVGQSLLGLERAKVIQRLETRVAELDIISELAQVFNVTTDLNQLLPLIYINCRRLLPIDYSRIYWREIENSTIGLVLHVDSLTTQTQEDKQPKKEVLEIVENVINSNQLQERINDKNHACLMAPLHSTQGVLGVLQIGHLYPNQSFTKRQKQFFSVMAERTANALERWQANRILQTQAQQLSTLNQLTASLNAHLDLEPLLELVLDASIDLLNTEGGSLLLTDADKGELVFRSVRSSAQDLARQLLGKRIPINVGIAGKVAQTAKPVIVNNAHADKRWYSGLDETSDFVTQTVLTVPLMQGNAVLGVLQVVNKKAQALFSETDKNLLIALAGQAVIAIENARLLQQTDAELQERVYELSLLQRFDRDLNTTLEIQTVLNLTLQWTLRFFDANAGAIILVDPTNETVYQTQQGYITNPIPQRKHPEEIAGITRQVMDTGRPHLTGDVKNEPNYIPASEDTHSQLTVPIIHEQKVLGAVAIESQKPHAYSNNDIERAERVIGHAAVALDNALLYEQLRLANNAKSEFVSMVSHELKTPMTAIRGFADLMLKGLTGEINEQQTNFLERIQANVIFMASLVSDLTDISRIETGQLSISLSQVDLDDIVAQATQTVQSLYDEKKITLHVDIPTSLPSIHGDKQRLTQVFVNLLSNACKYSDPQTKVTLTITPQDNQIICAIADQGFGMSSEDVDQLFTKFFRSSNPQLDGIPGTGLGLSITKGIIEVHGGEIWVDSELGEGTTFAFSLIPTTIPIPTQ